ncbi:luciferase domain-containing protein [Haloarchaeobius baliensis]|uniref:luciferase domain-containing protein n=1 Tax=Haloarchaeobius baliensis TaxID=1670458 RepID=UPI003F88149E
MEEATTHHGVSSVADTIAATVSEWPGVSAGRTSTGGRAFTLGTRELGHVHRSGLLDIQFERPLCDRLLAESLTGPHPLDPHSTWTSYRVVDAADVEHAVWLLWVAYLAALAAARPSPIARRARAVVDVDTELAALPTAVRTALPSRG